MYRNRPLTHSNYHAILKHQDDTYTLVMVRERSSKDGVSSVSGLELVTPAQLCSTKFWASNMSDIPVAEYIAKQHVEIMKADVENSVDLTEDDPIQDTTTPLRRSHRSRKPVTTVAATRRRLQQIPKGELRIPSVSK